ncbi:MAG TPA: hypothetical protein ENF21_09980 [Bacteroidetes bacterium]|nr:hypothetical protein [Bacteroidota bacterium]
MSRIIAQAISVLFHPLFAPLYGLLLIFHSGTYLSYLPYEVKKVIFLIVLLNTVVIPLSLFPILYYRKFIHGISDERPKDRTIPLVIAAVLYGIACYLLARLQVSGLIKMFIQAAAVMVMLTAVVSWFWKISLHMIGMGGLTGLMIAMMIKLSAVQTGVLVLLIVLAGVVGTARLYLNEHRPSQIYAGYLSGLGFMLAGLLL